MNPLFFAFLNTLACEVRLVQRASIVWVPSVEASSTTMTSPAKDAGSVASSASRHARVTFAPVWHGMMIDTAVACFRRLGTSHLAWRRMAPAARPDRLGEAG